MSHRRQSSASGSDINAALSSLSSCSRCRRRRIKCDNRLPACLACDKAKTTCEYPDHLLGRDVSRAYLASLVRRADELDKLKASISTHQNTSIAQITGDVPAIHLPVGIHSKTGSFWGPYSLYEQLSFHLQAKGNVPHVPKPRSRILSDVLKSLPTLGYEHVVLPDIGVCDKLLDLYHVSVETIYPILGRSRASALLGSSFDNRPPEVGESFKTASRCLLMLVFAISFQLLGQADRQAGDHAKRYFSASQQSLAFKTLSISERIEYLLLTCIYTLMDSKDDHIWSLLGLANQICVENYPLLEELEKRHLFSTLLILEVEVGATYGRPTSIQSNIPSFSAQDFRDFSVMSYHLFRLTKIQYRIHDLVVRATNDRHPYDSPVSVIHEELKEWMNGWSMASSNITSSSVLNSGYLLLIGTFLFERTLMRLLDLLSTTAGGVEERQEVATRLIRNCYAIYFEHIPQEQEQEQEASEANDRLIFPFFWTHTHSIFKAVLAIRQNETSSYSGLSTENNITLEKALALHIKFDRSKKLIDASMSLRAS